MAAAKKKKKKKQTKKQPTLEGLTKQVEILRLWILALKDRTHMAAWTYPDYLRHSKRKRGTPAGGPVKYP
jgi:hypothetical protein